MNMIKLKDLLKEGADQVSFEGEWYEYTTNSNRCTFFIYDDVRTGKEQYFGYSAQTTQFFGDCPDIIAEILAINATPDTEYQDIKYHIKRFYDVDRGGSHYGLALILEKLSRTTHDPIIKGRIFECGQTDKKTYIMAFWQTYNTVVKYKNIWNKIAELNWYNPKDMLYEPASGIGEKLTYDEMYGRESTDIPPKIKNEIDDEFDKKEKEYIQKSSDLHVKGAQLNKIQKEKLQDEVVLLKMELDLLDAARNEGKSSLKDVDLSKAILQAIHQKPKTVDDLYTTLEKQYGMPLIQIRNKFKGIPLDQLVKKTLAEYVKCRKNIRT